MKSLQRARVRHHRLEVRTKANTTAEPVLKKVTSSCGETGGKALRWGSATGSLYLPNGCLWT